jgi:8-oxo-dGTP pyrophosphatase MutT (NUDIX family)
MTIPGGGINKGEAPIDAAVRELHEELGLLVTTSQLRPLGLREVTGRLNLLSRHYLFVVELESMPVIQPARLEVIHYNWTRIDELGNVNYLTTPVIDAVATWSKP